MCTFVSCYSTWATAWEKPPVGGDALRNSNSSSTRAQLLRLLFTRPLDSFQFNGEHMRDIKEFFLSQLNTSFQFFFLLLALLFDFCSKFEYLAIISMLGERGEKRKHKRVNNAKSDDCTPTHWRNGGKKGIFHIELMEWLSKLNTHICSGRNTFDGIVSALHAIDWR